MTDQRPSDITKNSKPWKLQITEHQESLTNAIQTSNFQSHNDCIQVRKLSNFKSQAASGAEFNAQSNSSDYNKLQSIFNSLFNNYTALFKTYTDAISNGRHSAKSDVHAWIPLITDALTNLRDGLTKDTNGANYEGLDVLEGMPEEKQDNAADLYCDALEVVSPLLKGIAQAGDELRSSILAFQKGNFDALGVATAEVQRDISNGLTQLDRVFG